MRPIVVFSVATRYSKMTTEHPTDWYETDDVGPGASAAEEAAAHWVMRLTSGETTPEECADFARWRAMDPDHETALSALRGLWADLGPLLESRPPVTTKSRSLVRIATPPPRRRRAKLLALAASLVVGMTLGYQALTTGRYDEVTAAGERRGIALADGSQVILNGGTALDIHLSSQRREILIARGEAFFEVKPDASRPFLVTAGDSEVRVLGTRFSVRRDDESQLRVLVSEGRVEVRRHQQVAVLTANQQISSSRDDGLSGITPAQPEIDLAWRRGRLILQDAALSQIVAELNRNSSMKLMLADPQSAQRRFNAVIDLDHVDDWLLGLDRAEGSIQVTRLGPLVVIHQPFR
ncbi:MAG: FecR family protein [Panacagrimonas sp.]